MRILYLAHRIPYPPNKGDKIRSFHEIRGLTAQGHEVHLAAFVDDPRDLKYRDDLARICQSVTLSPLSRRRASLRSLAGLVTRQPLSLRFFSSRAMHERVLNLINWVDPEAIVVYSSAMTQYVPARLASRTVVDLVDADSEKWRDYAAVAPMPASLIYGIEGRRLRLHERTVIRTFARSLVTTPREALLLKDAGAADRLTPLANGVDLDRFRPGLITDPGSAVPEIERRFLAAGAPRIVFTGAMDYFANADAVTTFARDVWPLVRARRPGATFLIVGANPTRQVRRLGQQPGILVTGTVDDVRPYLAGAAVSVAPLQIARGIQNKVFEAMAMGTPVVTTAAVVAGLGAAPGRDVLVASAPEDFAAAVLNVIGNRQLHDDLSARARAFVEREHRWDAMLAEFVRIVESVATPEAARVA